MNKKGALFGQDNVGKSNFDKTALIMLTSIILFVLLILFFLNFHFNEKIVNCGDGTKENNCSLRNPYFCLNGILTEKASICGCPENTERLDDLCISNYSTNPKEINLKYILNGEEKNMTLNVYQGINDYLSNIPRNIYYSGGAKPLRSDFVFKSINEEEQKPFIDSLIVQIQNTANNKEDQARIAISIVQNIPFGKSNRTISFGLNKLDYSRYPYEVLYNSQGVCGEKSELLALLLKELGYGISLFYYSVENHEAVGIKCPEKFSLGGTGYCFVETSGPSIISDNEISYVGGKKLYSTPETIFISDGISLPEKIDEYGDAKSWMKIRSSLENTGNVGAFNYLRWKKIMKKYGLFGEYNL